MSYGWAEYKELMESKLAEAVRADHGDAPFPLDEAQAKAWHYARQSAFQYALEMMPSETPVRKVCPWEDGEPEGVDVNDPCPVCGMLGTPEAEMKCIDNYLRKAAA